MPHAVTSDATADTRTDACAGGTDACADFLANAGGTDACADSPANARADTGDAG
jgi:hypothetical protein